MASRVFNWLIFRVGPNTNLDDFKIPQDWISLGGPTKSIGWQGWTFIVSEKAGECL